MVDSGRGQIEIQNEKLQPMTVWPSFLLLRRRSAARGRTMATKNKSASAEITAKEEATDDCGDGGVVCCTCMSLKLFSLVVSTVEARGMRHDGRQQRTARQFARV